MNRKSIIVLISVVLVLAAAVIPVAASIRSGAFGGRGHGPGVAMLAGLREDIDLSDEQVIELRHIVRKAREEHAATRRIMKQNFLEAARVLLEDPNAVDEASVILERNNVYKDDLRSGILDTVSQSLKVLTPEQRAEINERVEMLALWR